MIRAHARTHVRSSARQHTGAGTASPSTGDPHFANVVLLVHGIGTNGSTTIVDSSSYARTPTVSGVTIFGNQLKPTASTGATVEFPSSVDFNIRKIFTLEFDFTQTYTSGNNFFMSRGDGGGGGDYFNSTTNGFGLSNNGLVPTFGPGLTFGVRTRICLCRDTSNNVYLFYDGVLQHSSTSTSTVLGARYFDIFRLVARPDLDSAPGIISEVRLTQGVCRYTADYTPGVFPDS